MVCLEAVHRRLGRADLRSDGVGTDAPPGGPRASGGYELADFEQSYREDRPTMAEARARLDHFAGRRRRRMRWRPSSTPQLC